MKTIFAIIGFTVTCMWGYHFLNSKAGKPFVKSVWDFSSPYINNAVNQAQQDAKRTAKR